MPSLDTRSRIMPGYTPDLFAGLDVPDVAAARVSENNPRCFAQDSCHWERHDLDGDTWWEIGIGRDAAGYHWTAGFQHNTGGRSGPVFILQNPAETFSEARHRAMVVLLRALSASYSDCDKGARDRLRKSVLAQG